MSSVTDTIKIATRVFFTLQFEWEGYLGDLNPYINVVPDEHTAEFFTKCKMLERKSRSAYVWLIETQTDNNPEMPEIIPADNTTFRFQVKMRSEVLSGMHIAKYDFTENVLYASNTANNKVGSDLLLTLPFAGYNISNTYVKGYMVQSGVKYYKAIQPSDNSDPHNVTEADYWKEIGSPVYISQADLRARASLSEPVDLDTVLLVEITHGAAINADYQLLDGLSQCREITYKIKFHNQ